jgi:propionate catabolism operon transcriptional regulator
MNLREFSICFFGSTQESLDQARAVADRMHMKLTLVLAGLDDAIPRGHALQKEGAEVVVSRRGTARLLRTELSIPVLALPGNSIDMFRAIKEASRISKRILVSTFRGDRRDIALLEEMFGAQLLRASYKDTQSLEQAIIMAKNCGCGVAVGGGVTRRLAQRHGLGSVILNSSDEAVASTLEDAKSVAQSRREERERNERYRTILDAVSEGILAVDSQGQITTINRAAKAFLKIPDGKNAGFDISRYLPNPAIQEVLRTGKPVINNMVKLGREQFIENSVPVLAGEEAIGVVSTFTDVSMVMRAENEVRRAFTKRLTAKYRLEDYCHQSQTVADMLNKVRLYAACDSTVLITGETGTGKEIIAHGIHQASKRRRGPFVSINCSALPDQLLESELFGYEEGAFTGSRRGGKPGLFELSHQGTLFLDEIGSTPMSVQTRLLRVLQEREVMRIGGDRVIPVDVRVVAATNQRLSAEVKAGRLREDLYFRLNVLSVTLPPLRDRPEDIPCLVRRLIRRASTQYDRAPFDIPPAFLDRLGSLPWQGNVRQLEHFIERLVLLCASEFSPHVFEELHDELLSYSKECMESTAPVRPVEASGRASPAAPLPPLESLTRAQVEQALAAAGHSRNAAAKALGVSRTTLWRRMRQMGLAQGRAGT